MQLDDLQPLVGAWETKRVVIGPDVGHARIVQHSFDSRDIACVYELLCFRRSCRCARRVLLFVDVERDVFMVWPFGADDSAVAAIRAWRTTSASLVLCAAAVRSSIEARAAAAAS